MFIETKLFSNVTPNDEISNDHKIVELDRKMEFAFEM